MKQPQPQVDSNLYSIYNYCIKLNKYHNYDLIFFLNLTEAKYGRMLGHMSNSTNLTSQPLLFNSKAMNN